MVKFIELSGRFYNLDMIKCFWLEYSQLGNGKTLMIELRDGKKEKIVIDAEAVFDFLKGDSSYDGQR